MRWERNAKDRGKEKKTRADRECNLDGEYTNPVRSFRDLTIGNIKEGIFHSRYLQLLLSLTLIGAILRFYNLGYNSLWLDEASTLNFAVKSIPDIWQATTAGEFNPPLFYWIEHIMLLFGNSEVVLRFIPALLGVLTIPLIYLVGKEFMDRNIGIIAAAAFAFSPFLLFYSQEARAYSMMLFFVTFSMVFYFRALKNNDIRDWALFGILSALAFWSHFYALVIIGALVLYALYELFPKIKSNLNAARPLVAGWYHIWAHLSSAYPCHDPAVCEADGICTNIRDPGAGTYHRDICTDLRFRSCNVSPPPPVYCRNCPGISAG